METPVEKLAFEFSKQLFKEIGLHGLEIVNARNSKEGNQSICHTHDLCDANEVIIAAYITSFDASPFNPLSENNISDQAQVIIDQAWTLAKANKFYYKEFAQGQENYKD